MDLESKQVHKLLLTKQGAQKYGIYKEREFLAHVKYVYTHVC